MQFGGWNPFGEIGKAIDGAVNEVSKGVNNAVSEAQEVANGIQEQARAQAEEVVNNVLQQQANVAIGQVVDTVGEVQKQAASALDNARGQAEGIANTIQQQGNDALGKAVGTWGPGSQATDTITQIINGVAVEVQKLAIDAIGNFGTQIVNTLGSLNGQILTFTITITIGIQKNVTLCRRTLDSNNGRETPTLVLDTIAGGSNPFPAFSSKIIQHTSQDSMKGATGSADDCGSNGDLQTFAACSAAKAAGLCSLDIFKNVQCRATCGSKCKY